MRSRTLAAVVLSLACGCAETHESSNLPPHTANASPVAEPGLQFQGLAGRKPVTHGYESIPRIGVIAGQVVAVSSDKVEIVGRSLAGPPAEMTLFVGPITRVTIDGRTGHLGELRPGMDVRASYTQDRSTVIADSLDLRTPEAPPSGP